MSDMKPTESENKRFVKAITGKEYRELNRTARPDMTNAEAAECITDFIEHFDELGFYPYYKDALLIALAALTPKTDENGHALCGCGGVGTQYTVERPYQDKGGYVECLGCGICVKGVNVQDAWERWDTAMGLRRDA